VHDDVRAGAGAEMTGGGDYLAKPFEFVPGPDGLFEPVGDVGVGGDGGHHRSVHLALARRAVVDQHIDSSDQIADLTFQSAQGEDDLVIGHGGVALILVYSAYVAEVYRAGIESVHPSQEAAARSLGLSHPQTLRYVIVPQAVRRVIPPLLNDFIGLQKDTALVALLGPVEAFRQSDIAASADFNFTPYLCAALLFILATVPLARFTDWLVARDRKRQLAGQA